METKLPNSVSLEFVEALYADYLRDPESVSPDWRQYFQSLSEGNGFSKGQSLTPAFKPWSIFDPPVSRNGTAVEEATGAILQERMESTGNRLNLSRDEQIRILTRLTDAVIFEEFIRKKFIGAKSFSLEGAESLIPLLDLAIERAGEHGIDEIVLGMAHRGRLNVLANIMAKSPRQIFREFADRDPDLYVGGRGDVKYHL